MCVCYEAFFLVTVYRFRDVKEVSPLLSVRFNCYKHFCPVSRLGKTYGQLLSDIR